MSISVLSDKSSQTVSPVVQSPADMTTALLRSEYQIGQLQIEVGEIRKLENAAVDIFIAQWDERLAAIAADLAACRDFSSRII